MQYCSSLHSEINPQQIEDLEVSSSPLQDCPHLSQLKEKAAGEDEPVPRGRGRRGNGACQRREQGLEAEGIHMSLYSHMLYGKFFSYPKSHLIICLIPQFRPSSLWRHLQKYQLPSPPYNMYLAHLMGHRGRANCCVTQVTLWLGFGFRHIHPVLTNKYIIYSLVHCAALSNIFHLKKGIELQQWSGFLFLSSQIS